jgi:protein TonB
MKRIMVILVLAALGLSSAVSQTKVSKDSGPVKVDNSITQPVSVKSPPPEYPEKARKAGIEGTVYVNILVDKEGNVKKAVVKKSDSKVLNNAALTAAKQWSFKPAEKLGKPVETWVVVPFKFRLKDEPK